MVCKCRVCGKKPNEIEEYIEIAKLYGITPEEYVIQEEGAYNPSTGLFYCIKCYIEKNTSKHKA